VFDQRENEILLQKQPDKKVPIASLTKLMTAMVVLDKKLPLDEPVLVTSADKDRVRYAKSRLPIGATLTRYDLLLFALMASENRAASALARSYPGGKDSFVKAMNQKAKELGLTNTHFLDAAGLRNENVSTASELLKLVLAADGYELIRTLTTSVRESVTDVRTGKVIEFGNTNRLVKKDDWNISLSKTGFTSDAGNCLVMKTEISNRPLIIVLLNSWGKLSKYGDSNRIKRWLINTESIIKALKL
jgi:D-alanyl-D-alanine endopeptidase (penicillin-binding protein 7)